MAALSSCKLLIWDQVLEGLRPGLHLVVFGALFQPFGVLILWVFGWSGAGNHFPRLNSQTCLHRREQHLQLQKSLLKEGETFTWLAVSNMGYFPRQLGWLSQATRSFLGCVIIFLIIILLTSEFFRIFGVCLDHRGSPVREILFWRPRCRRQRYISGDFQVLKVGDRQNRSCS